MRKSVFLATCLSKNKLAARNKETTTTGDTGGGGRALISWPIRGHWQRWQWPQTGREEKPKGRRERGKREVIRGREPVIDEATNQMPESDADHENKRCRVAVIDAAPRLPGSDNGKSLSLN